MISCNTGSKFSWPFDFNRTQTSSFFIVPSQTTNLNLSPVSRNFSNAEQPPHGVFICNSRGSDELCSSRERLLESLQLFLIETFSASKQWRNFIKILAGDFINNRRKYRSHFYIPFRIETKHFTRIDLHNQTCWTKFVPSIAPSWLVLVVGCVRSRSTVKGATRRPHSSPARQLI